MIEIMAKDYNHFYNIIGEYNIPEEKAIFVPWSITSIGKPSYCPPIYDCNVKRDCSDWIDYQSFQ